jgi:hypothetical protein
VGEDGKMIREGEEQEEGEEAWTPGPERGAGPGPGLDPGLGVYSWESFTHCWVESVLFFSFFSFSFFGIYEMTVSVCGFMRLDECKGGGSYAVLRLYLEWDWRWLWRVMMFLGFII